MFLRKIFLGVLPLCFLSPVVLAQNADVRLDRLENEIQTLSRAVYRGEAPSPLAYSGGGYDDPRAQADAGVRVQQLEVELRQLNGRLEEQSYEIRQLRTELERFTSDARLRFDVLEGGGTGIGAARGATPFASPPVQQGGGYQWRSQIEQTPPPSQQAQPQKQQQQPMSSGAVPSDGGAQSYDSAFSLLKAARYNDAEVEFLAFLKKYPQHKLVSNAKYWLGETYYVRGKYSQAAQVFAEGFQLFPKGTKAPDNLLKLGMSLSAMGKKDDACLALLQIDKEFSGVAGPVQRRASQEISRLGC